MFNRHTIPKTLLFLVIASNVYFWNNVSTIIVIASFFITLNLIAIIRRPPQLPRFPFFLFKEHFYIWGPSQLWYRNKLERVLDKEKIDYKFKVSDCWSYYCLAYSGSEKITISIKIYSKLKWYVLPILIIEFKDYNGDKIIYYHKCKKIKERLGLIKKNGNISSRIPDFGQYIHIEIDINLYLESLLSSHLDSQIYGIINLETVLEYNPNYIIEFNIIEKINECLNNANGKVEIIRHIARLIEKIVSLDDGEYVNHIVIQMLDEITILSLKSTDMLDWYQILYHVVLAIENITKNNNMIIKNYSCQFKKNIKNLVHINCPRVRKIAKSLKF